MNEGAKVAVEPCIVISVIRYWRIAVDRERAWVDNKIECLPAATRAINPLDIILRSQQFMAEVL